MPNFDKIEPKRLRYIRKEIGKLSSKMLSLQDWIDSAKQIDPLVDEAVEGIYCGTEGRMNVQLGNTRYYLFMMWYIDPAAADRGVKPKVETCYVS